MRTARPPTTPPTIAPVLFELLEVELLDDDGVEGLDAVVVAPTLAVVEAETGEGVDAEVVEALGVSVMTFSAAE